MAAVMPTGTANVTAAARTMTAAARTMTATVTRSRQ
jgi:hypothetical protein